MLYNTIKFILIDGIGILLPLFFFMVALVNLIQQYINYDRVKAYFNRYSDRYFIGNLSAAALGAITPFCSCSTIPIFMGMIQAGIPFMMAITFLLASPLVSEASIIIMTTFFGINYIIFFIITTMTMAMVSGMVYAKCRLDKDLLIEYLSLTVGDAIGPSNLQDSKDIDIKISISRRIYIATREAMFTTGQILPYLLIGIVIGGFIHGYVPTSWIEMINKSELQWLSIPIAALIGAPLYTDISAMIPIGYALLEKGIGLGAVTTFFIAGAGTSIPSLIMLSKLFKTRLLIVYFLTVIVIAMAVGLLIDAFY